MKSLVVLVLALTSCDCSTTSRRRSDPHPRRWMPRRTPNRAARMHRRRSATRASMVSFANDIRPLMLMSPGGCSPCHLGRITSGLDLSSYASMRRGGSNSGTNIIIPMKPCESILPGETQPDTAVRLADAVQRSAVFLGAASCSSFATGSPKAPWTTRSTELSPYIATLSAFAGDLASRSIGVPASAAALQADRATGRPRRLAR